MNRPHAQPRLGAPSVRPRSAFSWQCEGKPEVIGRLHARSGSIHVAATEGEAVGGAHRWADDDFRARFEVFIQTCPHYKHCCASLLPEVRAVWRSGWSTVEQDDCCTRRGDDLRRWLAFKSRSPMPRIDVSVSIGPDRHHSTVGENTGRPCFSKLGESSPISWVGSEIFVWSKLCGITKMRQLRWRFLHSTMDERHCPFVQEAHRWNEAERLLCQGVCLTERGYRLDNLHQRSPCGKMPALPVSSART